MATYSDDAPAIYSEPRTPLDLPVREGHWHPATAVFCGDLVRVAGSHEGESLAKGTVQTASRLGTTLVGLRLRTANGEEVLCTVEVFRAIFVVSQP